MRKTSLPLAILSIFFAIVASAGDIPSPPAAPAGPEPTMNRDSLHDYVLSHPEVVFDVLRAHSGELFEIANAGLMEKRVEETRRKMAEELAHPLAPSVDPARVIGPQDAPITIVEYSDFLCPYCSQAEKTLDGVIAAHKGQVRVVYKQQPHGDPGKAISRLYEAALMQDKAKAAAFHGSLFASQAALNQDKEAAARKLAADAGLDTARLDVDANSKAVAGRIEADGKEAEAFTFQGTPSFVVNGVSIRGAQPAAVFEEAIRLTAKDAPAN